MDSAVNEQLKLLQSRIEYNEFIFNNDDVYNNVLNRLLEDSKHIALSLRYPYVDTSEMELPKRYKNWQLRCCEEIYNQIGTIGLKSYSENGLTWTRDSAYISNELRNEIEPMIGYIRDDNNV